MTARTTAEAAPERSLLAIIEAGRLIRERTAAPRNPRSRSIARKKMTRQAAENQGGACIYCQRKFDSARKPTCEHIIPQSKGGDDFPENIAASCADCNQERGNANHDAFLKYKRGQMDRKTEEADNAE